MQLKKTLGALAAIAFFASTAQAHPSLLVGGPSFSPLVLFPGMVSSQLQGIQPSPITSQVKDGGVYHLATKTWSHGASVAALAGPEIIYDNTCTVGFYIGMPDGDTLFDSGRIPSTSSPSSPSSLTGLYDNYEVNAFTVAYCSFEPVSTNFDVSFADCYQACDTGGALPAPVAVFSVINAPAGTATGGQGCWIVTLDLANTTAQFDLGGDCNGNYDNTGSTDSFGWSWTQTIPTSGSAGGPLLAGDPLGFFANSFAVCGGIGGNTTFAGASAGPGTGIGIVDQFELGGGSTAPGCYWFGNYGAANPHSSFYLSIQGDDGGEAGTLWKALNHQPKGGAILTPLPNGNLRVGNLGSSGNDGFTTIMPAAQLAGSPVSHEFFMLPIDPAGTLPVGASITMTALGTLAGISNLVLDSMTIEKLSNGDKAISGGFSTLGSSPWQAQVYLGGTVVYIDASVVGPFSSTEEPNYLLIDFMPGTFIETRRVRWGSPTMLTIPGHQPVLADELLMVIPTVFTGGDSFTDMCVTTQFIQSLEFSNETTSGFAGNTGSGYCFGDGTGAPCPCGNTGNSGAGCANSSGNGVLLAGSGSASFSNDTISFAITGVNGVKPGLMLRGNNQVNGGLGNGIGDGLICAAGGSQRSHVQLTDAFGTTNFNNWNGASMGSVANMGSTTYYQFWYRDPMGGPCASGFNFSNAWAVSYLP